MKPLATLCSTLAISFTLIISAAALTLGGAHKLDATQTDAAVTSLTTKILEGSQFAHRRLDDGLAGKFLDLYLDSLDGNHLLFLQTDVQEFAQFRSTLAKNTRSKGDTSPARAIFKRYMDRLQQRAAYVDEALKGGSFDFTSNENYEFERKDAPRPADLAAAQKLWLKNLRYEYLQEKLAGKKDSEIPQTLSRRSSRLVQTMRKFSDHAVLELYLNALAHVYDPHSDYMGHEELQNFNIDMNLSFVGIGATLQADDGYCKVTQLVTGGPAARNGQLKIGDRIVGVAQGESKEFTDLVDMPLTQAVDLIRGAKGSSVRLSVIPAGPTENASSRKTITIVRDEIKLEDQQAKARIVDLPDAAGHTQRLGVIDLPGFYANDGPKTAKVSATADVARLLKKLKKENVKGMILDLRRNGGGSLEEAISLTGLFIPSGPVVQTRDLDGRVELGVDRGGSMLYDGPLIVLISRMSASASEIVAGALQDYGRAIIVGDGSTFGKGTVQTMVPLDRVMQQDGFIPSSDPGALKVTISKFYRPSGKSTQLEGVKSDIVLPSLSDIPDIGEAKLDNPLPWDTIKAAEFTSTDRVSSYLATLRTRSAGRIAKDPDFAELAKRIEEFRKAREAKTVSLNEAARRAEKTRLANEAKERHAAALVQPPTYEITLKNAGKTGLGEPLKDGALAKSAKNNPLAEEDKDNDKSFAADEVILHEAEEILADYSDLLSRKAAPPTMTHR